MDVVVERGVVVPVRRCPTHRPPQLWGDERAHKCAIGVYPLGECPGHDSCSLVSIPGVLPTAHGKCGVRSATVHHRAQSRAGDSGCFPLFFHRPSHWPISSATALYMLIQIGFCVVGSINVLGSLQFIHSTDLGTILILPGILQTSTLSCILSCSQWLFPLVFRGQPKQACHWWNQIDFRTPI
jgi:hypothetical protein